MTYMISDLYRFMAKKHLNLYVDEDVIKVAKSRNINLSVLLTNCIKSGVDPRYFFSRSAGPQDIQATSHGQDK